MVQATRSNPAINDVLPGDAHAVDRVEGWFRQYAVTRDPAVRERIIVSYLGLADRLAERYRGSRGATPEDLRQTARVRDAAGDQPPLRFHFHNTRNTGFANAVAAVELGATVLDASAGGIGGCPFAPRATGNIATDDLVFLLERMGLRTGYDLEALLPTAAFLGTQLGHEVPALLPRAGVFPAATAPVAAHEE